MSTSSPDWPITNTEHGMLVAFGEFLQQHGLLDRLRHGPITQKTHDFAPQAKLIEFLAGIMSGIEHLQDLNHGPRPLAPDAVVARAWGLGHFAHYTTVGRTLAACDAATVSAVEAAIAAFSRPFIETTVQEVARRSQRLVYDFDLMGQGVSATSTTYPEAAFGWMNDQVRLGYQLARVSLSPPASTRVWLAGFHHPGDTVSSACLQELLHAAEAQTGVRPRRRPQLVSQRIEAQRTAIARTRRLTDHQQAKLQRLQQTHTTLIGKRYHAEQVLNGPISQGKQARLQTQADGWQKRLPRLAEQIAQAARVLAAHQARLTEQEAALVALHTWQAQLAADNETNPNAPEIEARADAGFASGENLTWLLEMGYAPNSKAPNGRTTTALRAHLPRGAAWEKVGDNAEMALIGEQQLHGCPYPLTVALERFKVGRTFKYATLVRAGPAPKLVEWFAQYNARQTIEAGNKEMNGTFFVQHLMSRAPAGIRLQVLFTGLAANVVRWRQPWLKTCAAAPTPNLTRTLGSPKALVRVAANSAALVQHTASGTSLLFGPRSALPGAAFTLHGVPAIQLPLGFHQPCKIASDSTRPALNAHYLR
ncbi:MAG TPA: hypothetical protein VIK33_09705 [Anaerolineae bacterium]